MKYYLGIAYNNELSVDIIELRDSLDYRGLDPRHDLVNHSPDGFNWGYNGSGPAQLAFAILMDYTNDEVFTRKHYQQFKANVIAKLPQDQCWTIQPSDMEFYCQQLSDFNEEGGHNGKEEN